MQVLHLGRMNTLL